VALLNLWSSPGNGSRRQEARLLARLQAGDESAFETIYERHMPPLYRYALRMTGSASEADDVVQDLFLTLIRDARGFDPARGELRSYLYGVARRIVLNRLPVELQAGDDTPEPAVKDDPFEALDRAQRLELVRTAVAALPAGYREVVALCDLEEMSYADAALVLNCAVGTVRSRLHRARAMLLERMEKLKCGTA
jgi:RNA polymerase sigma-70 factor (ECF subfamily)